jgi:hypothetical protein
LPSESSPFTRSRVAPSLPALYADRGSLASSRDRPFALGQAFDREAIDLLLFLSKAAPMVSGDGVLRFARLIAADLAGFQLAVQNGPFYTYQIGLTPRGLQIIRAWQSGDRAALTTALGDTSTR